MQSILLNRFTDRWIWNICQSTSKWFVNDAFSDSRVLQQQRTLTYFVRGRITVRLVFSLDSTKKTKICYLLWYACTEYKFVKPVKTKMYRDTSPHGECSLTEAFWYFRMSSIQGKTTAAPTSSTGWRRCSTIRNQFYKLYLLHLMPPLITQIYFSCYFRYCTWALQTHLG